jgi:transcriptional regulator with XRE-family HTH domain
MRAKPEIVKEWARQLREIREEAGLTQEELAQRHGVTVTTISRWENAKAVPHHWKMIDPAELIAVGARPSERPQARQQDPAPLNEAIGLLRFFWDVTDGEGPYWKHLMKELEGTRHAMKFALPPGGKSKSTRRGQSTRPRGLQEMAAQSK